MSKRSSRNRKRFYRIEAAAEPKTFAICGESEPMELVAAGEGAAPNSPKKFSMVAYTGAAMQVGYGYPVVVDLAGGDPPRQATPIFRNHDPDRIVGHTNTVEVTPQRIKVSGVMSGDPEQVDPIVASAGRGFPWQASIGAKVGKLEFIESGQKVKVNGRNFDGPVYVARQWTLGEISFVPIGADTSTSASVAASQQVGVAPMDENLAKRLKADGFDPTVLSAEAIANMKAMYAMKDAAKEPSPAPKPEAVPTAADVRAAGDAMLAESAATMLANYRSNIVAEQLRVDAVARTCKKYDNPRFDDGTTVEAKAIASGWDEQKTHLECLLIARGTGAPNFIMASQKRDVTKPDVLECALAQSRGLPNIEKHYKPETLEAANRHFRHIGVQQLFLTAASANGYQAGPGERINNGNIREVLRAAFGGGHIQASGFSTVSLSGILGNVANKELLTGYMEEDQTWKEVSRTTSVNDFKQVTAYRMLDNMEYEEVGPTGKIAGGTLDQESYTRQAKTYAKMFSLTRRDIVNDDLGAFDDLRNRLGRGSMKKFNNVFWTKFLYDHATFYTTARTNYITGATTNLGSDGVGLGLGVKAFRQMRSPSALGTDDGGKRIGGNPVILVVPPELEGIAEALYRNQNLGAVATSSANIYANKYRPVVVPWLSDTAFTGYSATAWFLFRNPSEMAPMVVSFLNGMMAPTVESTDADFDTLGVQFRGYHDFGCDQSEYLAGVKSKGAA